MSSLDAKAHSNSSNHIAIPYPFQILCTLFGLSVACLRFRVGPVALASLSFEFHTYRREKRGGVDERERIGKGHGLLPRLTCRAMTISRTRVQGRAHPGGRCGSHPLPTGEGCPGSRWEEGLKQRAPSRRIKRQGRVGRVFVPLLLVSSAGVSNSLMDSCNGDKITDIKS